MPDDQAEEEQLRAFPPERRTYKMPSPTVKGPNATGQYSTKAPRISFKLGIPSRKSASKSSISTTISIQSVAQMLQLSTMSNIMDNFQTAPNGNSPIH
jgi:hypothetical protein